MKARPYLTVIFHRILQVQHTVIYYTGLYMFHRQHKLLPLLTQTLLLFSVVSSSDPASLIWIRNQMLFSLCEILNSDSLLIKE